MSVKYNQHPVVTVVDPDADWNVIWDTGGNTAARASINNSIANATLPGANLVANSVALSKLPSQAAATLLGRGAALGVPEVLTLSADLTTAGGVLALVNSYQPFDSDLTAIATLATAAYGRNLLTLGSAAAGRTALELLTPTSWGTTDKLVTTHNTSVLLDMGAQSQMLVAPTSSATNVEVIVKPKGSSELGLMSSDEAYKFIVSMAACKVEALGLVSADFITRTLRDDAGVLSIDWNEREMDDVSGNISVQWRDRTLLGSWSTEALTATGAVAITTAGAASTAALLMSGAPFLGNGTTSFPLLYVQDATATPATALHTQGTYLGVNGTGTADLINIMLNGNSKFRVRGDDTARIGVTGLTTVVGAVTIGGTVVHTLSATPASAAAAGTVGTISWDADYVYVAIATNTWKRAALSTW